VRPPNQAIFTRPSFSSLNRLATSGNLRPLSVVPRMGPADRAPCELGGQTSRTLKTRHYRELGLDDLPAFPVDPRHERGLADDERVDIGPALRVGSHGSSC